MFCPGGILSAGITTAWKKQCCNEEGTGDVFGSSFSLEKKNTLGRDL